MHISNTAAAIPQLPSSGKQHVPRGLADRGALPPGIAKKIADGGTAPPGILKRFPAATLAPTPPATDTTTPSDGSQPVVADAATTQSVDVLA
jgi:hypothetical protein